MYLITQANIVEPKWAENVLLCNNVRRHVRLLSQLISFNVENEYISGKSTHRQTDKPREHSFRSRQRMQVGNFLPVIHGRKRAHLASAFHWTKSKHTSVTSLSIFSSCIITGGILSLSLLGTIKQHHNATCSRLLLYCYQFDSRR